MMIQFKYINLRLETQVSARANSWKRTNTKQLMVGNSNLRILLLGTMSKSMDILSTLLIVINSPKNGMPKTPFGREWKPEHDTFSIILILNQQITYP